MQQFQKKNELNSLMMNFNFFHSELYSVTELEDQKYLSSETNKIQNPTTDGPSQVTKVKVKTYSKKKLTPKYEISFEKQFMKEHKAVFRKKYQNYIEAIKGKDLSKNKQCSQMHFLKSQGRGLNQSALHILKNQKTSLNYHQKEQFMKDLQHEQKLNEFLDFVVCQCHPEIALRLIGAAHVIWMIYVPKQHDEIHIAQIIRLSEKIANNELKAKIKQKFGLHSGEEEMSSQFIEFMKAFCTTILLTINGYFQNPYFSEDGKLQGLKRSWDFDVFSEDESSFESWPQTPLIKKRKSQNSDF